VGGNLPVETNPVTGLGQVFGQAYSIDLTTAFSGDGAASPFGTTLTTWGFDPAATNEFQIGFLLDPVPAPEPTSAPLLLGGIAALGVTRRRRLAG
jgi:PEP-CTERM motif